MIIYLEGLDYQPDKPQQPNQPQQPDQELPLWIESKDRLNGLRKHILSVKDNELKTNTSANRYNFNGMKKLIKDITNNKITKDDAINKVGKISVYVNKIKSLRQNKNQNIIVNLNHELRQLFDLPYMVKIDDETDDETDDEQPDTTDMFDLKSEESAEQRRKRKGQGLKILTPDQMLSGLTISLAQLKAGNNSEKLKNEITETIYNNLITTIKNGNNIYEQ